MQNKNESFCFHSRGAAYLRVSRVVQTERCAAYLRVSRVVQAERGAAYLRVSKVVQAEYKTK
ncbi:MAG: hypothetical protein J5529_00360 [Prevotella sp.]|nr:hypothetical protein [Prevotella sp.]